MFACEACHATHMVVVFVRHHNTIELIGQEIQSPQTPRGISKAEPAIQHEPGVSGVDDKPIPFAAAAQGRKAHHLQLLKSED